MNRKALYRVGVIIALGWVTIGGTTASEERLPRPTGLMCELMALPEQTLIEDPRPEFSWIVNSDVNGDYQTAYQILVSSTRRKIDSNTGDVWDSGRTNSDKSSGVSYAGPALSSDSVYWWKLRVGNGSGAVSEYSTPQMFRSGQLSDKADTVRYRLVTETVRPAQIKRKGKGHYFVDFAKAAFGTIELVLTSPTAGHKVELHLGEVPAGSDAVQRNPGGSRRYRTMVLSLDKGTRLYRVPVTPDNRNTGAQAIKMPAYVGEVMPFRYCEIVNAPCELAAEQVRQIAVHYPFDDRAARFHSSDPVLNDIWDLCKYSIKATSFCGVYVDGDRERIPYEADAYINQLCHYCVDRQYNIGRYSHEYLITHPAWPTEWILHSVLMAWADYMYTADKDSIERYYDDLKAKTLLSLAREDGLISTTTGRVTDEVLRSIHFRGRLRDIVDWPHGGILGLKEGGYGETDGYVFTDINTVVNAFHYRALVLMGKISRALEKTNDAARFAEAAKKVRESFNTRLFDPKRGVYVDGEGTEHSSLHANMFPLAFGLVPDEHVESVVSFVKSRGMACSVYGAQYLFEALYAAGADEYAMELLTNRSDRGWAHMVYDVGTTITSEAWDNKYKPNQDFNHAWGAAPANIIPRRLMGIQPLEPAFAGFQIKPQPGRLRRAALDMPTVRGTIHSDFIAEPRVSFVLNVNIPANTQARVYLPRLGISEPVVLTDGCIVEAATEGRFLVLDNIGSGVHQFELRK